MWSVLGSRFLGKLLSLRHYLEVVMSENYPFEKTNTILMFSFSSTVGIKRDFSDFGYLVIPFVFEGLNMLYLNLITRIKFIFSWYERFNFVVKFDS